MVLKQSKTDKIKKILKENPNGLWVREIARKSNLDKSTVSRYLIVMHEEIEFSWIGRNKVFKLKNEKE